MSIQLRPYQEDLKGRIYARWAEMGVDAAGMPKQLYRNVMAVMPTGTGKTSVFSRIIREVASGNPGRPVVAIAHRQELVAQMSLALAREGLRHMVIAPENVRRSIRRLHRIHFNADFLDVEAQIVAAGVDTLIRREFDWYDRTCCFVIDECFPAWVKVDGRNISDIKVGEFVTAFNEHTGLIELRRVTNTFRHQASGLLVTVKLKSGQTIQCTKGHPFWTKRGWIEAGELEGEDHVYVQSLRGVIYRDDRSREIPTQENREDILLEEMRMGVTGDTYPHTFDSDGSVHALQAGSGGIRLEADEIQAHRCGVLLEGMHRCSVISQIECNHVTHESHLCERANDCKESNALCRCACAHARDVAGNCTQAESSRREWQTPNGCGNRPSCTILGSRILSPDDCGDWSSLEVARMSESLQGRLREFEYENRNRSGREQSLLNGTQGAGSPEGCMLEWVGVESVSILKSTDIVGPDGCVFDGYVYNIEVEGLHTYIADGIVVHNCHHTLRDNKWGQAAKLFPNALGLGVTASPIRGDGKGLGSGEDNDGIFDVMEEGPAMGWAISQGYLTDYKVLSIPSDVNYDEVAQGSDGDYNQSQLRKAVHKSSKIVGDVVEHYLAHAAGKLGIAFCVDVQESQKLADKFNEMGVPAACLSAQTSDEERARIMVEFRERKILVLCNCDILGEGVDVPAVEVVMMVRKTLSLSLFLQQFGRALRPSPGKTFALILDHVGNVLYHRYPDVPRVWSLARPERRSKKKTDDEDIEALQSCTKCYGMFEKFMTHCPYCGEEVMPAPRPSIKQVAGDLVMLDPELFGDLQRQIEDAGRFIPPPSAAGPAARAGALNRFREKRSAQDELRNIMGWYGGYRKALGLSDREAQKSFYLHFGIDVMTAQTLNRADTEELRLKIEAVLQSAGVEFTNLQEQAA